MTVKEIVIAALKASGNDGLCDGKSEGCGCGIDNLMPCVGDISEVSGCEPAYACRLPKSEWCEDCTTFSERDDGEVWYCQRERAKNGGAK